MSQRDAEAWAMLSGLFEAAVLMPKRQRAATGTLPLTVISGFLGAGKTTLLNRLLQEPHGRRLAVLVNDFGRIEVDAALIRSRQADTISLTNGCACCSTAGDLTRTLIGLSQQDPLPDAIVLEASGLADPHGIAQVALANPALRLEGVLALVDAETIQHQADDPTTRDVVRAQLMAADLLVLNKVDLVAATDLEEVRRWLDIVAPSRPVVAAEHGAVPVDVVLGLQGSQRSSLPATIPVSTQRFETWTLESPTPLNRKRVQAMLDALPPSILRAKGLLLLSDDPAVRTLYQRVGRRWSMTPAGPWEDQPGSGLVLIGAAGMLEKAALQWAWREAQAP